MSRPPGPSPDADAVKEHYRGLAPEYSGRANATCEAVYGALARRFLGGLGSVVEIGGGSAGLLGTLGAAEAVACDLSEAMLRARGDGARTRRVVAAGERLPFPAGRFDGALCVNVLEHVADVDAVLAEAARVLRPGGMLLAITPNGRWERLLDLAERLRLKIPEGPHAFLRPDRLAAAAARHFEVVEHATMLAFPAGGPRLARLVDRLTACDAYRGGFFQSLAARART